MREIVHIQVGQCGNQIGAKVNISFLVLVLYSLFLQYNDSCQPVPLAIEPVSGGPCYHCLGQDTPLLPLNIKSKLVMVGIVS